ncbi:hypothetical protein GXW82_16800 [Streptacidiphilus sp. 4-A2]|nr:hypothetical protein [Streptacidiphilus sp. 4-A2]
MSVVVAITVLLAVMAWMLLRNSEVRFWQGLVFTLLGVFLAVTPIAPELRDLAEWFVTSLTGPNPPAAGHS